jgi:LPS-assembly protein
MKSFHHPFIVIIILCAFFTFSLAPQQVIGQVIGFERESDDTAEGPVTMEADKLTYDQQGGFISLEGRVKILYQNITLQADNVIFYDKTRDVVAEGGVVLTEGEDILRCDRLEFNIDTKKGTVHQGRLFLKKKNFHITGSKAEKLGEQEYRVYDATLTSCDARVPDWKFTVKRLDVEIEGYGEGWWPGFHVKNIPVLYFPWAIFPVKRERQSGFLFPGFGTTSKWGPEIRIPFYWVIAPNQDATFYLERIGDTRGRGFKEGVEYRYAWSRRAEGQIRGFYIWDEREQRSRWSIFAEHDQTFPGRYYIKADVNWVSDKDYPVDFDEDIPGEVLIDARSRNNLESTLILGKDWEWGALGTEFSYFRDLKPDPRDDTVDNNRATMQRLPQATFFLYQDQFLNTPFFYEMEAEGTHFWREELPTNPNLIADGEILKGGRIDLQPRLSVPLKPFDMMRFEPWAGYRETIYFPNDPMGRYDEITSREMYDVGVALGTTISRVFPLQAGKIRGVKHIIEPELVYEYIPRVDQWDNQRDNPFFDEKDRISRKNEVRWILTNYVIGKVVGADGDVTYPEYLYLKLQQGYDFSPHLYYYDKNNKFEGEREHLSNLMAEGRVSPFTWLSGTMDLEYNPHQQRFDVLNTGIDVTDKRGDRLNVEYRFSKRHEVKSVNTFLTIRTIDPLDFYFAYRHNLRDKTRIETVYGLDYRHQCWEVSLRVHDINHSPGWLSDGTRSREDEIKVKVYVTLTGLGGYRVY